MHLVLSLSGLYETKGDEMEEMGDFPGVIANYTKAIEGSPPIAAL